MITRNVMTYNPIVDFHHEQNLFITNRNTVIILRPTPSSKLIQIADHHDSHGDLDLECYYLSIDLSLVLLRFENDISRMIKNVMLVPKNHTHPI